MSALPYVRPDALPSHDTHPDTGCDVSPSCIRCPLPVCRYEMSGGLRQVQAMIRAEHIRRARAEERLSITEIVARFGVSRRVVFRALAEGARG